MCSCSMSYTKFNISLAKQAESACSRLRRTWHKKHQLCLLLCPVAHAKPSCHNIYIMGCAGESAA